jgi:hypothetical protein
VAPAGREGTVSSQHKDVRATNAEKNDGNYKRSPTKWWGVPDWWIVIFTLVLASFAVFSFIVLWIQVKDARRFFAQAQRPYVWVTTNPKTGGTDTPILEPNKVAMWNFYYTNFGQSPAVGVVARGTVVFGKEWVGKVDKNFFSAELHTREFHAEDKSFGFVIPPGDKNHFDTARLIEP